jgi:AcrR family transcriptional regulator
MLKCLHLSSNKLLNRVMPSVVRKLVRRVKRRLKVARQEGRTWRLDDTALRLMAQKDYELISVAEFAREAGTSVGAFYGRYRDKEAFIYGAISGAFHGLTHFAKSDLDPRRWRRTSTAKTINGVVQHIVERIGRPRAAGATRAALKLATIKPHAIEPFTNYRKFVADRAVELLAGRLSIKQPEASVRNAVQAIFGIVTDAAVVGAGPMRLGSDRMVTALSALMSGYLDLEDDDRLGDKDDEAEEEKAGIELMGDKNQDRTDLIDPDLLTAVGSVGIPKGRVRFRRGASAAKSEPITVVDPRTVKPAAKRTDNEKPARKRKTFI